MLKLCTFKVHPKFRGEKLGELLLKQAIWFAQRNGYDVVYLTAFPDQGTLIRVIEFYGFQHTQTYESGEQVFEKLISREPLSSEGASDLFALARLGLVDKVAHP